MDDSPSGQAALAFVAGVIKFFVHGGILEEKEALGIFAHALKVTKDEKAHAIVEELLKEMMPG